MVRVEVEETVYRYQPARNGSGPMWCAGSTCLFRFGDRVWATGLETDPDEAPLNNCHWVLWLREDSGWQRVFVDRRLTREPAPIAGFHDGSFVVSGNPPQGSGPEPSGGSACPELFEFGFSQPYSEPIHHLPVWRGKPPFREHSCRSLASDGARGALIVFQNIGYGHAEWSFRDASGHWVEQGQLHWPDFGSDANPQRLRLCSPNVALADRTVHFFGVGDIIEPVVAWRDFKHKLTGQAWDYAFRRLFYSHCSDIGSKPFVPWIEMDSRELTAGFLWPCDLWMEDKQRVHLLWTGRTIDERLRSEFFPSARQRHSLEYAVVENGEVVLR